MTITIFIFLIILQMVISADPYCRDGFISNNVCCHNSCVDGNGNGVCGGYGCSSRGLGAEYCCSGNIRDAGVSCEDNNAPCLISDDKVPKKIPSKSETGLSLVIIVIIIIALTILCLFVNTGSNRKFEKRGYIEDQRDMFITQLNMVNPLD